MLEKLMSDEEKIQRAIEISQRRNKNYSNTRIERMNINNKKDFKLFKRMILQIIICLLIYTIFYLITTSNYIFSNDIIKQTSAILNYDINFNSLYNDSLNYVRNLMDRWKQEEDNSQAENNNELTNNIIEEKDNSINAENKEPEINITQMEEDAKEIKEKYSFIKPVNGIITSGFGQREVTSSVMSSDHKGIDIAANEGTNIQAATNGQVEEADKNSEYGNYIKIKQDNLLTVYAHCKKIKVNKGDKVKSGDVIATVGSTGNSTGPHLHFEIRLSNRYINPSMIIQF